MLKLLLGKVRKLSDSGPGPSDLVANGASKGTWGRETLKRTDREL